MTDRLVRRTKAENIGGATAFAIALNLNDSDLNSVTADTTVYFVESYLLMAGDNFSGYPQNMAVKHGAIWERSGIVLINLNSYIIHPTSSDITLTLNAVSTSNFQFAYTNTTGFGWSGNANKRYRVWLDIYIKEPDIP